MTLPNLFPFLSHLLVIISLSVTCGRDIAMVGEIFDELIGRGKAKHRRDLLNGAVGCLQVFVGFFELLLVDIFLESNAEIFLEKRSKVIGIIGKLFSDISGSNRRVDLFPNPFGNILQNPRTAHRRVLLYLRRLGKQQHGGIIRRVG